MFIDFMQWIFSVSNESHKYLYILFIRGNPPASGRLVALVDDFSFVHELHPACQRETAGREFSRITFFIFLFAPINRDKLSWRLFNLF